MITLALTNFMSYNHFTTSFEDVGSVLLQAPNGSGKSAFLESIPYALFGKSRVSGDKEVSNSQLSNDNGDGSHSVSVTFSELGGSKVQIVRGVTKSGKGVFEVHKDDQFFAKGREAQEHIEQMIGMTYEDFILTSFYGLRGESSDPVLNVGPSQKLEQLQRLGRAEKYPAMQKRVQQQAKATEQKITALVSAIETLENDLKDESQLEKDRDEKDSEIAVLKDDLQNLRAKRQKLDETEQLYLAHVSEIESVEKEKAALQDQQVELKSSIQDIESDIEDTRTKLEEAVAERDTEYTSEKQSEKEARVAFLGEEIESKRKEQYRIEAQIRLRETTVREFEKVQAQSEEHIASCPLCASAIEASVLSRWEEEISQYKDECAGVVSEIKEHKAELEKHEAWFEYKSTMRELIGKYSERIESLRKDLGNDKRELETIQPKLAWSDERIKKVRGKLEDKKFEGIAEQIRELDSEIESGNVSLGELQSDLRWCKEALESAKTARKVIDDKRNDLAELRIEQKAYSVLVEAFSRYGIPMQIVKGIFSLIESVATEVYSHFDSAQIVVSSVEDRANPGVQYKLKTRSGERPFTLLSEGQRAMFYLAIRVAFTELLSRTRAFNIHFLVLDELTAKLDADNRDRLVILMEKVLRERFPLVFMVSHAVVPDVFSRTLSFRLDDNGITQVREI